jgi:hypothetical protein
VQSEERVGLVVLAHLAGDGRVDVEEAEQRVGPGGLFHDQRVQRIFGEVGPGLAVDPLGLRSARGPERVLEHPDGGRLLGGPRRGLEPGLELLQHRPQLAVVVVRVRLPGRGGEHPAGKAEQEQPGGPGVQVIPAHGVDRLQMERGRMRHGRHHL